MNLQAPVLLAGHLEFGDAVVLNGAVRALSRDIPRLAWLTSHKHAHSVKRMVADLKNVRVIAVSGYEDAEDTIQWWGDNVIRVGYFQDGNFNQVEWDRKFYQHAGLPFDARWSEFALAEPIPVPVEVDRLWHEDTERRFFIRGPRDGATIIDRRPCILDWLPEILGANELHFIDSAFLNLAESLYAMGRLRNTQLFFHRYAKTYPGPARWPTLHAPWKVVD